MKLKLELMASLNKKLKSDNKWRNHFGQVTILWFTKQLPFSEKVSWCQAGVSSVNFVKEYPECKFQPSIMLVGWKKMEGIDFSGMKLGQWIESDIKKMSICICADVSDMKPGDAKMFLRKCGHNGNFMKNFEAVLKILKLMVEHSQAQFLITKN